jgi:hypothetical protein
VSHRELLLLLLLLLPLYIHTPIATLLHTHSDSHCTADYSGYRQADGEGLWHGYAEQIRATNEARQRDWDEHNAAKAAAAKKRLEGHAHEVAMQVSGFGRYKSTQAQRIAEMRLAKQRKDMAEQAEPWSASGRARAESDAGQARRRPGTAPPERGSAARRIAEIEGRRRAWRNGKGMIWGERQPWFEDVHQDFENDARYQQMEALKARFERQRAAAPVKAWQQAPHRPDDIRLRGNPRKGWLGDMHGHLKPPNPNAAAAGVKFLAADALRERRAGAELQMAEARKEKVRKQFRGDMGDRYERGPNVRVGKNKGGGIWNAHPDFMRMMGNQETRYLFPHNEVGRRLDDSRTALSREAPIAVRQKGEEAAMDEMLRAGGYWCDRGPPAKHPATGHGHAGVPAPEGKSYRQRWPYKDFPHKHAPGVGPVPPQ